LEDLGVDAGILEWITTFKGSRTKSIFLSNAPRFPKHHCLSGPRDSSVGIATRHGLDGPGIESWCTARFSAPVQTGSGTHPASYTMGTGSFFQGVKGPWRGVGHLIPTSAEVKERVDL
jgi:hypothetical protein